MPKIKGKNKEYKKTQASTKSKTKRYNKVGHTLPPNTFSASLKIKQHRNQAKFDLLCFQRFENRFGGAEGAAPYKA